MDYLRFGKMEKAMLWLNKAKEEGVSEEKLNKVKIPAGPILTDGLIKGRLLMNGQPACGIRVGLFGNGAVIWKRAPGLVFAVDSDSQGNFSFNHLGAGKYFLALMAEQDVIPNDISQIKDVEKLKKDFIANVSHELKTPLTAIKGFA